MEESGPEWDQEKTRAGRTRIKLKLGPHRGVLESDANRPPGNPRGGPPFQPECPWRKESPEDRTEGERKNSMRRHAATLASFLLLLVAAVIGSCARPYHEENERYFFVATNINLPYWQEAQAGFLDAAKQLGVKAELVGPATYDPGAEATIFRDLVDKQP